MSMYVFLIIVHVMFCESVFLTRDSAVKENALLTNRANNTVVHPNCKDEKFLQVLASLKVASPEDLFQLAMGGFGEPRFCRELTIGTDKITQYVKHCYSTPSQDLYVKLISGMDIIKQKLCNEPDFRVLFDKNKDCYNILRYETDACGGPQDWLQSQNSTDICKTMKQILGCYYKKTLLNCDLEAAEVLNDLMKDVMSSVSDDYCPNIVQTNYIRDFRSLTGTNASQKKSATEIAVALGLLVSIIM